MFEFATPYFLFLLPVVGLAAVMMYRRRVRRALVFPSLSEIPRTVHSWRTRVAGLMPALILLALILMIIALARPRSVHSRHRRTADVIAIEMAVDISGSMNALDLSTRTPTGWKYRSRLDAVKDTFAEFIDGRPDDLVGLITFGGYAVTRVPLTTDHGALRHTLEGIEVPRELFIDGRIVNQEELLTAVGDALAMACARLRDAEPESRIVVLLSDGESNTGAIEPPDAIRLAKQLGIKVYTIGIGAPGRTRAPFWGKDMFGRRQIQHSMVSMDEALLTTIAKETGGQYFNVRDPEGLAKALEDIDTLETTRVAEYIYSQYDEHFPWFLFAAMGLVLTATSVNMLTARRLM